MPAAPAALVVPAAVERAGPVSLGDFAFGPVAGYEARVPRRPGLYAVRVLDLGALPAFYAGVLAMRGHRLLYVGQASTSLEKRLGQELRARGPGTFFRSLGALLGFTPPAGSLVGCANQNNYRFDGPDGEAIKAWLDRHAEVAWVTRDGDLDGPEAALIAAHLPLMNLDGNPAALPELVAARNSCKAIARGSAAGVLD